MAKIIESVINVSAGRDQRVVEKLANVLRAVDDIQLLDVHICEDHHRTVYTFLGTPEGVFQAAYNLAESAMELIDLSKHEGEHPYLGAVDVIPLVPVKNASFEDCIKTARKLGAEVEKHLHIPVYFYEKATQDPKTKNLADLRAQGYNLKKHHTAGTTAIGVRDYLIAYNIDLESNKIEIAKKIAKSIREKDGGLKGVKALGMKLDSKKKVQVSMNLTEPFKTTPKKVWEAVKKEAKKYKVKIASEELVGLLPEQVKEAAEKFNIRRETK